MKKLIHNIKLALKYKKIIDNEDKKGSLTNRIDLIKTYVQCRNALENLPEIYHPISLHGFEDLIPKRPCKDRLQLIIKDMDKPPRNIVDIGCQIGYFSFSLAQMGYSVNGYDINKDNIKIANMLKILSKREEPKFKCLKLNKENIPKIETADYIICLAVFHHIIYYEGLDTAQSILCELKNKIRKKLYFEIGQSNEPVEPWAKELPDMGHDPLIWITDFLRKGGFKNVTVLGLVPTHVSDVYRYLIAAD